MTIVFVKQMFADAQVDNMKGITAINIIIILVLGVMALVAVIGMFMGVWSPAKSGTSLEAATKTVCRIINPSYCNPQGFSDCVSAERIPVYDFDANNDGVLNEHTADGVYRTSWKDDNFGSLCYNFHGGPEGIGGSEAQWYDVCLVRVCGCARMSGATCV